MVASLMEINKFMASMQVKKWQQHSLYISILIHMLLLLIFVYHFIWLNKIVKRPLPSPAFDMPAYVYHQAPVFSKPASTSAAAVPALQDKQGRFKPKVTQTQPPTPTPVLAPAEQMQNNSEAIHLIGDKKVAVKPLMKLLGYALTPQLIYPRIAMDFNIKGTTQMGFMIHPDGTITDIQLLQSSGADLLDQAALTALRAVSPLRNAGLYVHTPKYIQIGVVFR